MAREGASCCESFETVQPFSDLDDGNIIFKGHDALVQACLVLRSGTSAGDSEQPVLALVCWTTSSILHPGFLKPMMNMLQRCQNVDVAGPGDRSSNRQCAGGISQ